MRPTETVTGIGRILVATRIAAVADIWRTWRRA